MSRSVIQDLLQVYPFWLLEVAPIEPLAIPMLTPIFGFSSITAPEIQVEVKEISEANWYFKKKVVKGGDVSNIILERGATWYDSDFWRWILVGLTGNPSTTSALSALGGVAGAIGGLASVGLGGLTPRRTLMLVQFMSRQPTALPDGSEALIQAGLTALGAGLADESGGGLLGGLKAAGIGAVQGAVFGAINALGPFEFTARLPAKAWILRGCIPVRYKAAGDYDASSSAISIQQLEIAFEVLEEVALSA